MQKALNCQLLAINQKSFSRVSDRRLRDQISTQQIRIQERIGIFNVFLRAREFFNFEKFYYDFSQKIYTVSQSFENEPNVKRSFDQISNMQSLRHSYHSTA